MGLFDHYLIEDHDQVTDHLENLHETANGILTGAIKADFSEADSKQVSMQHSIRVLVGLHKKKLKHEENMKQNYAMYKSQGWMRNEVLNKS